MKDSHSEKEPGVVAQDGHPCVGEAEPGGSQVQGRAGQQGEKAQQLGGFVEDLGLLSSTHVTHNCLYPQRQGF